MAESPMKSLGGFFDKFNGKLVKQIQSLDAVVTAIKKHANVDVDLKDLSVRGGILRIHVSALQKNEIFIKKARILKELEGKLRALKVTDIQ